MGHLAHTSPFLTRCYARFAFAAAKEQAFGTIPALLALALFLSLFHQIHSILVTITEQYGLLFQFLSPTISSVP